MAACGPGSTPAGCVLLAQRHENARHDREVEAHVELVPVAKIGTRVLGPLVGLGQQNRPGEFFLDRAADLFQDRRASRQVLAIGALTLEQIRHGVARKPSMPIFSQKRITLIISARTAGYRNSGPAGRHRNGARKIARPSSQVQLDFSVSRKMMRPGIFLVVSLQT